MGFWEKTWEAAKAIGKGVKDVFVGIVAVLVLTVYAIGYVIFTIAEHLYNWIDQLFESGDTNVNGVTMVDPIETEKFIKSLGDKKTTQLPPYTPNTKRTMLVAHDKNGKVTKAQIASTDKGFEAKIEEAFKKGHLVEQPVEVED